MAVTHVMQDLQNSLIRNGVGNDADWDRIGGFVTAAQQQYFNPVELFLSGVTGRFDPTFNIGVLRDQMRNGLKAGH